MPIVLFGISLKWFIRILLILFWAPAVALQLTYVAPALEWLWNEHVFWWTGLVVFTVLAFEPRRKKQVVLTDQLFGGEKPK